MKQIKENKLLIIPVGMLIIVISIVLVRNYIGNRQKFKQNDEKYVMTPKKYGVNEYSLVSTSEEQMASTYLNDYKNLLMSDINESYNLLNSEYKRIKYPNIETFKNYVNSINLSKMIVDRYGKKNCGEEICYYIYDKLDNVYIFRVFSVMEYEVYLDDNTIEI